MRAVLDHAHIVGKNLIRIEAIMSAPNRKALFEGFFAHYGGRYAVFGAAVFDISDDKAGGNPKECDPQEVYFYEYNNHECMIAWDGDKEAYDLIVGYWGEEVAKTIKRI